MRRTLAAGALLLAAATPARAHRLDEYLQAATITVEKDRVRAQLRLAPGVAVAPAVLAGIDADGDGTLSDGEQRAYAERVLGDLSLAVDGGELQLRLASWSYPTSAELKEGRGEIQLAFEASVPRGGPDRRLVFENRHQRRIAAYLVNCLLPRDPDVQVAGQRRNYEQSSYQLDYVQAGAGAGSLWFARWTGVPGWLGTAALLPVAWLVARRRRPAEASGRTPAQG